MTVNSDELRKISYDEFVSFIMERAANNACECCGNDTWTISTTDDGININLIQSVFVYDATAALWSACMACNQCGNIRAHSYQAVTKWVEDRSATE